MKINILALVYLKINFPAEHTLKKNNVSRPNLPPHLSPKNQMVASLETDFGRSVRETTVI